MMIWIKLLLFIIFIFYVILRNKSWNPKTSKFILNSNLVKLGHRGAPNLAYENTLASFQKAIDLGMDGVELDVQLTADKKIVVYHDWHIEINGKMQLIEKLNYKHIQNISLGKDNSNKIPLLSDVLDILNNNCIINIEIKSQYIINTNIEKIILFYIKKYKFEKNCIISSFNPMILYRIKQLNQNIITALLWTRNKSQLILNSPLWVWYCLPDGFHVDIDYIDSPLMNWIRKKKLFIFAFTIETHYDFLKAVQFGVDGVITDDPLLK